MKITIRFDVEFPGQVTAKNHAAIVEVLTRHARRGAEQHIENTLARIAEEEAPGYWRAAKVRAARQKFRVVGPE